ncbi:MAG: peptide ABC transporter permease, partial [Pseudomonadota bacterium]|nr:peptide ABC transporter permease [Pseudomonadota bacterium]
MKNGLVITGAIIVFIMGFLALFADFIAPFDPTATNISKSLIPPSFEHPMGTDQLGRDVFSRMVYGARISLLVGFVAVGISTLLGVFFGAVAGFYGGKVE